MGEKLLLHQKYPMTDIGIFYPTSNILEKFSWVIKAIESKTRMNCFPVDREREVGGLCVNECVGSVKSSGSHPLPSTCLGCNPLVTYGGTCSNHVHTAFRG